MSTETQTTLLAEDLLRVGHSDSFSEAEINDVVRFIDKTHYLHYPFNEDGSRNPYQYCYGLGYFRKHGDMWGAFISGLYPNAGFWKTHFRILVARMGLPWLFRHSANIYRIVAFEQEGADSLLQAYERFCYEYRRSKILFSLPTKKERDAVCNWDWFGRNGYKDYGYAKGNAARIFVKVLDFEPAEYSPYELERQFGGS